MKKTWGGQWQSMLWGGGGSITGPAHRPRQAGEWESGTAERGSGSGRGAGEFGGGGDEEPASCVVGSGIELASCGQS